ncbi:hypothetical protein PU630_07600 [Microbacterium horticulturae]|uniref:Uncharacterized protein n=1 Tax=Microbacterium horticulturae TaxID=3028316 RepID=A0ABY8C1S6_9MICO|nr:hypothetical protein [Microbacterium sp. KACC 23027]WEG10401.1 hypothetical protein PU630_07600 [Microbacterium sp. KACC 23027]
MCEAGCPDVGELPEEVAVALDEWAILKPLADVASRDEKAANAALKKAVAKMPQAARFGAVGVGPRGGFQVSLSESVGISEVEWAADDPEVHAHVQALRAELAVIEAAAKRAYPLTQRKTSLRFQEAD